MLDGLVLFKTKLRAKLALWRSSCAFYEKLTAAVGLFHPPEIQNSWFIQLLTAVDALHSNKIFHKYIHPGFIVFTNDTLKLKHYEKSSIVPDGYSEQVRVNASDLCYMCPEFNKKNNQLNLKYDIWFENFFYCYNFF